MKLETKYLSRQALDWAVMAAADPDVAHFFSSTETKLPGYSSEWFQGGPLIEREHIELEYGYYGKSWHAVRRDGPTVCEAPGPTPLVAAMRCYVMSQLGDTVDVPDYLVHDDLLQFQNS